MLFYITEEGIVIVNESLRRHYEATYPDWEEVHRVAQPTPTDYPRSPLPYGAISFDEIDAFLEKLIRSYTHRIARYQQLRDDLQKKYREKSHGKRT